MCWPEKHDAQRAAGLVLLAGALGCGGQASSDPKRAEPAPAAPLAVPTSPPAPAAQVSTPPGPAPAPIGLPTQASPPTSSEPALDFVAADVVVRILVANCASCHGPAAPAAGSGGIRFIDDLDRLIAAGLIVPLSSATSPIVRVIVSGSMPPASSGLPALTEADLATLVMYIDNPRFWPNLPTPAAVDAGTAAPAVDGGADAG